MRTDRRDKVVTSEPVVIANCHLHFGAPIWRYLRLPEKGTSVEQAENPEIIGVSIRLHVWGERACFVRPEFKLERVSYDVMTPAAARGVLSAIHWRPSVRWHVDRIHVLKPIRFETIGNDDPDAAAINRLSATHRSRLRRAAIVLADVSYVIEAHLSLTGQAEADDSLAKHLSIFDRQIRHGRSHRPPCLGIQNFPAETALLRDEDSLPGSTFPEQPRRVDLGWMLHDFDHETDRVARYFRAEIVAGVIAVPPHDSPDLAA